MLVDILLADSGRIHFGVTNFNYEGQIDLSISLGAHETQSLFYTCKASNPNV